jgi:hypothetical protein
MNRTNLVMSTSQFQHLLSMINQISSNNNYKKIDEETAEFVADHIKKFWTRAIKKYLTLYC